MLTQQLVAALIPLIGFRADPPTNGQADLIPDSDPLTKTTTGKTVDQCHELLTLATIKATGPQAVTDFAKYLSTGREDAIRALLTNLETRLIEAGLAARLLKPKVLFEGIPASTPTILKLERSVGLLITVVQNDVTVNLERIRLSASVNIGFVLTLTNQDTSKGIPIIMERGDAWQDVGLPLSPGIYTLTYEEDELGEGVFAKNTVVQWPKQKGGCRGCSSGCVSSYVSVEGLAISPDEWKASRDTNYGINLVFSADGDVSGRLVDNPRRLLPALEQQMAVSFLSKIAYSTRHNGPTEEAKNGALFALTDKDNADRVPLKLDRALSSLVKALAAEASSAIDVNPADDITWGSI